MGSTRSSSILRACALFMPLSIACGDDVPSDGSATAAEPTSTTGSTGGVTDTSGTDVADSTGADAEVLLLPDGTEVVVGPAGELELRRDGRTIFALAEVARPTVRTFGESWSGGLGMWTFARSDEVAHVADTFVSAAQTGDEVEVVYAGADLQATLRIAVEVPGEATRITIETSGIEGAVSVALPLRCDPEGTFFGFGEQYVGTDQRGEAFELFVSEQGIGRDPDAPRLPINGDRHTTYFPMPYWLDARGFGGLLDTAHRVDVDLCASDPEVAWLEARSGEPLGVTVFGGPTPRDVIRQLGARVGRPARPPDWAWRLWIGAQGGQDDVLAEVDALELADIPVGVLWVQDWTGIRPNFDGGSGVEYRWLPDTELYPDLAALTADLHARDIRFLGYANPFVDVTLEHYPQMQTEGLLVQSPEGGPYVFIAPNGMSALPDLGRAETREYVRGHLEAMVTEYGMDGWMADFGEWLPLDSVLADGSDPLAAHNLYPVAWHAVNREALDAVRPDGDYVVFARSGFTGVHAQAQVYWAGDQEADFLPHDGLPTVVPALINLGLAGIPWVTHDIAGFSGGPSTKELFQRWTELGAFTPIMRTHEGANEDDNWSWERDAETTAHFRRFARIHDALVPEIMAAADEAEATSMPILRHLMLAFPDDPASLGISDQFMLGDTLLVAPVVTDGATLRTVYLPPGDWVHVWTGDAYIGGTTIEIDAPIGSPPVFSLGADRPDLRAIE
jgi:sulfoquinovosidase